MSKSAKKIPLAKEPEGKDAGSLASAWSPLRESVFRALWIATVVSSIGTWMQDVGESWLMTSLTTSPVLVALVETFGSLPVVPLALPAGALADIVDRRSVDFWQTAPTFTDWSHGWVSAVLPSSTS